MKKLNINNLHKANHLFANVNWELSVKAVIAGFNPGEIFVDDTDNPAYGIITTPEGDVIGGELNSDLTRFTDWINNYYLPRGQEQNYQEFTLYCDSNWEDNIRNLFHNRSMFKEKRYHYIRDLTAFKTMEYLLPQDMKLLEISKSVIDNHKHYRNMPHIKAWLINNWGDYKNFQKYGFGIAIIHKDIVVSWSLADCAFQDECEIGIHTDKDYRRQGYATITIQAMLKLADKLGYHKVGWHCGTDNIGSYKSAEKCGFVKSCQYFGFYGRFNENYLI